MASTVVTLRIRVNAPGGGDEIAEFQVDRASFIARARTMADAFTDLTPDTTRSVDIKLPAPLSRASVVVVIRTLQDRQWPGFDRATGLFWKDTPPDEKLTHWNAAVLADYIGFVELVGFYIIAFASALKNFGGREWFIIRMNRGTKRPLSSSSEVSDTKRFRRADPRAFLKGCVSCGHDAVGTCAKCQFLFVCSPACLALVHAQCYAFTVIPTSLTDNNETFNLFDYATSYIEETILTMAPFTQSSDIVQMGWQNALEVYALLANGPMPQLYATAPDYFYYNLTIDGLLRRGPRAATDPLSLLSPLDHVKSGHRSPNFGSDWAICAAAHVGRIDVVQMLIGDRRVDPAAGNRAIILASTNGHVDVVKLLIKHVRVDPSTDDNAPIRRASEKGHAEVVQLLIADKRTNPSANRDYAIRFACENGHDSVVAILLKDTRVDPSIDGNIAIRQATRLGRTEVVRLLLKDGRADPTVYDNTSLSYAAGEGHADIVQLLLADPRVDPSAKESYALYIASANGHIDSVKALLSHPRIRPEASNNRAITSASSAGRIEIVALLKKALLDRGLSIPDTVKL